MGRRQAILYGCWMVATVLWRVVRFVTYTLGGVLGGMILGSWLSSTPRSRGPMPNLSDRG